MRCWRSMGLTLAKALLLVLLCSVMTMAFNVTFEETVFEWKSSPRNRFHVMSGIQGIRTNARIYPRRDYTLGTQKGKFIVAEGLKDYPGQSEFRILYSACLTPTGPRCTLRFHTWMSESRKRLEQLSITLMTYCQGCADSSTEYSVTVDLPQVFNNTLGDSRIWVSRSVQLGAIHSLFVIAFVATVPDDDSVLAIDNIYLQSCNLVLEEVVCGPSEFRCPHTAQCIPRTKVCDLHKDCQCGQDESASACEGISSRGIATFQECDFGGGHCYWYSVKQLDDQESLPWKRATRKTPIADNMFPSFNDSGPYVYVSPYGIQAQWTSQLLRSVDFPALPAADGSCSIRFQYWLSGDPKLTVQLLELGGAAAQTLWQSRDLVSDAPSWEQAVITINNGTVRNSYVLQVSAAAASSYRKSAVALTNISLTAGCFGQDEVHLSTCGAEGPEGPTQEICDARYPDRQDITVATGPPFTGAQLWTVPTSARYSLQAYGARGGQDKEGTDSPLTYGSHVHAKFRLNRGDRLAVVVGQKGENSQQVGPAKNASSGGGGGGATFVFRLVKAQEPELLIMAGGGGGLNYASFPDTDNETESLWAGEWESGEDLPWTSLTSHSNFTGRGCHLPDTPLLTMGGFGAGFGACRTAGGHGGGANISHADNRSTVSAGLPGAVFVHHHNLYASFQLRSHPDEGGLEVRMVSWRCPCDFLCRWERPERLDMAGVRALQDGVFRCLCPAGSVLAADGLSCVPASGWSSPSDGTAMSSDDHSPAVIVQPVRGRHPPFALGTGALVSIIVIFIFIIAFFLSFVFYGLRAQPQDRLWPLRVVLMRCLRNRSQSIPLHTLAATAMPARVMHINPNYSFTTCKVPGQKLPEIPRDNLRMSTQLGHGAFGEVYKGFLSGMSGTEREVAVAVKTLPPLCSEQTELDFYMEAFIISKFHHPNIVQFLGVCFEQHPRYIVLELLEGGNLKSFLRESRPTQGGMSKLSVGDLVALAKDICCGCCYLEEHHFIHRDIAARNCLLTSKGPERVAKIADFGMSRDVYRADYYKKEGRALLPLKWMPPEAFMEGMFTSKTDIWSYGVVLWEIFAMGYMPYPALSNTEVMNFIYIGGRLDCPEGCPPAVYDLMLSCWKHKSEERPTFAFVMQVLETILQDTATMSQHLPAFRLPHLNTGCNGRSLKLLNHPVPDLGLHFHQDLLPSSPSSTAPEASCLEPLLKAPTTTTTTTTTTTGPATPPYRPAGSLATRADSFAKRSASMESDSVSSKGSNSSLEPLLPLDCPWQPEHGTEAGFFQDVQEDRGACEEQWDSSCPAPSATDTNNVLMEKERRAGQRVRLPPLGHRGGAERLVSVSSLSTLEENDELTCDDSQNSV